MSNTNADQTAESAAPQDMIQHCLDMADRCKQEARILMEQAEDLILRAGAWQQRAVQRQQREAALIDGSGAGTQAPGSDPDLPTEVPTPTDHTDGSPSPNQGETQ